MLLPITLGELLTFIQHDHSAHIRAFTAACIHDAHVDAWHCHLDLLEE